MYLNKTRRILDNGKLPPLSLGSLEWKHWSRIRRILWQGKMIGILPDILYKTLNGKCGVVGS